MSIYDIKSAVIVLKLNTVKYVLGILIALNPDISIMYLTDVRIQSNLLHILKIAGNSNSKNSQPSILRKLETAKFLV